MLMVNKTFYYMGLVKILRDPGSSRCPSTIRGTNETVRAPYLTFVDI